MKAAAIILIVLVLAAVGAVGWLYLNANMVVRFENCIATDAVSQLDYFGHLKDSIASSSFVGTLYTQAEPGTADNYQFLSYTVRLTNRAFLDAEVIEIRITPMEGDVAQIGETQQYRLPAGKTMDLSATILTARGMHSVREATVTCYFWGIPFTTKITVGR